MKKIEIAFLFPLHNEEERVIKVKKFESYARKRFKNFKFVFILNNCSDNTEAKINRNFNKGDFIIIRSSNKNRGAGLNLAFKKIKCNFFAICAVDNAWGFNFYTRAHKILKNNEIKIVYGPKSHPRSKIQRNALRQFISILSKFFLKILFNNDLQFDSQCIKMFASNLKFLKKLKNFNYFAETEFAISANRLGIKKKLIPVKINKTDGSKVNFKNLMLFCLEAFVFMLKKEK